MKVLLINGSPNAKGCTYTALSEVEKTLRENGIETEMLHVGHLAIHGCIGCRKCKEIGRCVFDDIVNEAAKKFEEADGIVLGSPVYYAGVNGALTTFLDRLYYSTSFDKRMKVGAAVCSARRAGTTATLDALNKFFLIAEMPIASSQYWNMVHGNTPEEVLQDAEGLQTMRVLGHNMAFLIRAIHSEKARSGLPEKEPRVSTNFIR